jgi:hypothetical protein
MNSSPEGRIYFEQQKSLLIQDVAAVRISHDRSTSASRERGDGLTVEIFALFL